MNEYFEDLPDDNENILKQYLLIHIDFYINTADITDKEKIECAFIKKFFQFNSLTEIFEAVEFEVDDENKCIIMNFKEKIKLYVDNEYNKYVKNE